MRNQCSCCYGFKTYCRKCKTYHCGCSWNKCKANTGIVQKERRTNLASTTFEGKLLEFVQYLANCVAYQSEDTGMVIDVHWKDDAQKLLKDEGLL